MIYLDNAATTQINPNVVQAMLPYLNEKFGNPSSLHRLGREAAMAISNARGEVSTLIGCDPEQIVFTSGGSESNNMVLNGLSNYLITHSRTHIITTQIEHKSVLKAVQKLVDNYGFTVDYIKPMADSGISYDDVVNAIEMALRQGKHIGLVSIMHTNNETGVSNAHYFAKLSKICRENKIFFHSDCVQALENEEVNVKKLGLDFASFSGHKIHAPKGTGFLYIRKHKIQPMICGGDGQEFGLRGGTENVAGIVGLGEACFMLSNQSFNTDLSKYKQFFYQKLKEQLRRNGVNNKLYINSGDNSLRCGKILNFRIEGIDSQTLILMLDSFGVCVSAGSACNSNANKPSHVLLAMGLSDKEARESIRVSFSRDNSLEDVYKAAEVIGDVVAEYIKI